MTNRIALVTGGTRGIGRSICESLQGAGYKVVANFVGNDAVADAFTQETGIPVYKFDVSNYEECKAFVTKIETEQAGPIDVLINNAGITRDSAMHKMQIDAWEAVLDTNLTSCFNMSRAVIEGMRERKFGRIINISSVNGQLGQFGQTNYSAAKAGVLGFTKALARESAARGITVNAIAPGYIETDMVKAVDKTVLDKIVSAIPVGRLGQPEEIGRAVLFLAADESGFITGETLSVNGGQNME